MKDVAFFTMLCGFILAMCSSPAWGWFLLAAVAMGVFS